MIRDAVYTLGQGDPESFTVRFAMLLQAHFLALNDLPDRLKQTLEAQSKDSLTQQIAIRKAAEAYTQITTRQVNEIVEAMREFQRGAEEERKTARTGNGTASSPRFGAIVQKGNRRRSQIPGLPGIHLKAPAENRFLEFR
jgi:hypothetical protein